MSGYVTWQDEMAVVRDVLRWADTTSEFSPGFSLTIFRGAFGMVAAATGHHAIGATPYCEGGGETPEKALVALARALAKDGYHFPALDRIDKETQG